MSVIFPRNRIAENDSGKARGDGTAHISRIVEDQPARTATGRVVPPIVVLPVNERP